jgi:hypothetical protein
MCTPLALIDLSRCEGDLSCVTAPATLDGVARADAGVARSRAARGRVIVPICAVVAFFAVTFAVSMRRPVQGADEAWFLWVAHRLDSGATLYRDVYYVTTPLAMWIMRLAVAVFGTRIAVERALQAACLTASVAFSWFLAKRAGLGLVGRVVLVAVLFAYSSPVSHFASVYSMFAVSSVLGAGYTLVVWLERSHGDHVGLLAVVGGACGIAFATKPNTGFFALAASGAALATTRLRRGPARDLVRPLAVLAASFSVVAAATLLPLVADHSWSQFYDQVVSDKRDYLYATGGFLGGLTPSLRTIFSTTLQSFGQFVQNTRALLFVASAVALATLGLRAVVRPHRWRLPTVAIAGVAFGLVGVAAAAPDFGSQHQTETLPLLLAGVAAVVGAARPAARSSRPRRTAGVLCVVVAGVFALAVGVWANRPADPGDRLVSSTLPSLGGTPISFRDQHVIRADLRTIRARTGGSVFFAWPAAGYYYLAGDLRDPTRYDFPAVSDLGAGGVNGLIATMRRDVRWACVRPTRPPATWRHTAPTRIERYVRSHFLLVTRLPICDLYRAPQ